MVQIVGKLTWKRNQASKEKEKKIMMKMSGKYFCGNEISDYGQEHGFVDYATLVKAFDAVLNNDIISKTYDIGYWDQESGFNNDYSEEIEEIEEQIENLTDLITDETSEEEETKITEQIEDLEAKKEEYEEAQDYYPEIFQYYIVSDSGAEILKECNEIVFYNDALDMYVWGVTHWGTAWSHVLTDIPCNCGYEE